MVFSEIEDGLYISGIASAKASTVGEKFDIVITVCKTDPKPTGCSHQLFELHDDYGDQQEEFDRAVGATIKAIQHDGDVLVHCVMGVSRSPTVVATALAWIEDRHFDDAMETVQNGRSVANPHPALRTHGLRFLEQDDRKPFTD